MATPLVTIAVWEFTPSRRCTLFQDASVDSLLVRLHFLDIPFHETETPYAFPKPREAGDNVNFDFVKGREISVGHSKLCLVSNLENFIITVVAEQSDPHPPRQI